MMDNTANQINRAKEKCPDAIRAYSTAVTALYEHALTMYQNPGATGAQKELSHTATLNAMKKDCGNQYIKMRMALQSEFNNSLAIASEIAEKLKFEIFQTAENTVVKKFTHLQFSSNALQAIKNIIGSDQRVSK
jgi:hypothetical protein